MLTPVGNVHRHTMPQPGAIVTVRGLECTGKDPRRKAIVESFPVTDSADYHFSRGIHTVTLRFLDNGARRKVAGHTCWEVDWAGFPAIGARDRGDYSSLSDVEKRAPRILPG